jgi:diguanylate cyclase (GGDEF)-like protein
VAAALALLFVAAVNLVNRALKRQEETEVALVEQSAALEDVAMHDPLTGLPNRLLFNDRLHQSISNARRKQHCVSLFVLDVDGFKNLNDRLGHEAGDILLKETAARLQASVRASDTVARIGGDEFVILAVDAELADAELIQKKVGQRMDEPVLIDGSPVSLRLSIGVAVFPEDGTESAQLLRRADSNMYLDKRAEKAVGPHETPAGGEAPDPGEPSVNDSSARHSSDGDSGDSPSGDGVDSDRDPSAGDPPGDAPTPADPESA